VRHQLGVLTHALSDKLHALAHRLVGDENWRMRNGLDPAEVMQVFESLDMSPALARFNLERREDSHRCRD
jgi:hypothetical protein